MTNREVYPNAPLRLVSLEFRFPLTNRVLTRALWDSLEEELGSDLPEVHMFVEDPESHLPSPSRDPIIRRISINRKRAVTLYSDALTIELADYRDYGDLRSLSKSSLNAFDRISETLQCSRVGLRFINEVRPPFVQDSGAPWSDGRVWVPYINNDLVQQIANPPDNLCAFGKHGSVYFHSLHGNEHVSLNYGVHPEGIVDPEDVLILGGSSGPCFVLDIDAFVVVQPESEEELEHKLFVSLVGKLHDVAEDVFQWSVTDLSREVFRDNIKPTYEGDASADTSNSRD